MKEETFDQTITFHEGITIPIEMKDSINNLF